MMCWKMATRLLPLATLAVGLALAVPGLDASAATGRGVVVQVKDSAGRPVALYRGSHALLIGVSDYTAGWPDLESVPAELTRVERALEARGFQVVKHLDPDGRAMRRAFEDFVDRYGYDRDSRLLFFFAGHGHSRWDGRKGYLVPADAPDPRVDERGFLRKAVSMTDVLAWARRVEAKHAIFLFDACFSGTVFKARDLPDTPPHISALTAAPVRQFLTAGTAGEAVPAQNVFTPAFTDAIERGLANLDQDGYVTGTELGVYLQGRVPRHARQTSQFGKISDYALSRGDFVFQVGRAPAPSETEDQAATGGASPVEIAFWQAAASGDDPEEYRAYLKRYPQGAFADLARIRLQGLRAPPASARVTALLGECQPTSAPTA